MDGTALGHANIPACYVQDMALTSLAALELLETLVATLSTPESHPMAIPAAFQTFLEKTQGVLEMNIERDSTGSTVN